MKKEQESDDSCDEIDNFEMNSKLPSLPIAKPTKQTILKSKYKPVEWEEYFDYREMVNGQSIYIIDREQKSMKSRSEEWNRPLFVFLHGAGMTGSSFSLCSSHLRKWANVVCFDWRGHGDSLQMEDNELECSKLIDEAIQVLEWSSKHFKQSNMVIVGHSMGGSIAVRTVDKVQSITHLEQRVAGLIVIDVVEGTAMEALPFMEKIVSQRPKQFDSLDDAIEWTIRSKTIRNLQSARVSVPQQLKEELLSSNQRVFTWKVDLLESRDHWVGWFKGLTQSFLNIRIPKLLLLAEKERMDKELTIAQMQGKFRLTVLHNVGHSIHEDDPLGVAKQLYNMIKVFKMPVSVDDQNNLIQVGIGKFQPSLQPFQP